MTSDKIKAFVVGYTGLTGKALVKALSGDVRFKEIVLIGRRIIDLQIDENQNKFKQVIVDFDKLEECTDIFSDNYDAGFCCLGTTRGQSGKEGFIKVDYDYTVKVAELSKRNCKQYHLVSSSGSNSNSSFLYMQIKGKAEETISKMEFQNLVIYKPKMLQGHREQFRFGEVLFGAFIKPIQYMKPTALTTPVDILSKCMLNKAASIFDKQKSNGDTINQKPEVEVILNDEIFKLSKQEV